MIASLIVTKYSFGVLAWRYGTSEQSQGGEEGTPGSEDEQGCKWSSSEKAKRRRFYVRPRGRCLSLTRL